MEGTRSKGAAEWLGVSNENQQLVQVLKQASWFSQEVHFSNTSVISVQYYGGRKEH